MEKKLAAFLLLLFVTTSMGGRTNRIENECSMKCDESPDSLFKKGSAYSYLYEGESEIKATTGSYDSTGLKVKAKVTVTGLSNCQMKLKMSDVEVFDRILSNKNVFLATPFNVKAKEILEAKEVLFTRHRGLVKSVCVDKKEPIWSQNLKKSIIDILTNHERGTNDLKEGAFKNIRSLAYNRETRHGKCFVENIENIKSESKTIQYDMKSCKSPSGRSLFTDISEAIVFKISKVSCEYVHKDKDAIQTVHCTEEYSTNPLRESGSSVDVKVKIRMERTESKGVDMSYTIKDLEMSGIRMKDNLEETVTEYFTKAKETLKLMCALHTSKSQSEIPKTFMVLVNELKKLTPGEVKEIYSEVMKTDLCPDQTENMRSMFYDAIGFVNTPAATSVMVDLIKRKRISEIDQSVWFTSLSFMQSRPTLDMIKDLETLLQTKNLNKQMYLGISAVTHLYCKDNSEECLMDPTIRNILTFFTTNLGQDCSESKNKDSLSKILISLKSLGNLKLFNEDVVKTISKCVETKTNPIVTRVSTLEVMKHMDCSKDRSVASMILEDNQNDSEIRINAYLTVMGCPDINTMFNVQKVLRKEKVNQVGSFIWTHLTNIQESSDVLKKDIKDLLNDVELKNDFDISKLKFSRNIEKTFSLGHFGMNIDSNVIFSEKSFIPRSMSLNTTAIVLNRPTNFIELSARMEGLDDLLFKLLGPDGYLKSKNKQASPDDYLPLINTLNKFSGNFNLKLFGQQISFVELIRGTLGSIKKYNIIDEIMNSGALRATDFKKNIMLLDKVANLPTSLGFPLQFRVQGSVSVNLNIKSKVDILAMMSKKLNIDIQVSPTIMSEFLSEVVLETPFSNYGMSMRLSSGTDTAFKAVVSASNKEEFSIKFEMPKTKNELITVSGKSFVIYQDQSIEQLKNKFVGIEMCSSEESIRILGLRLCGNVKVADLETRKTALLYGPFAASIYVANEDLPSGYILKGLFKEVPFTAENNKKYLSRFLSLRFDTPDSKQYYREFAIDMALDFKEQRLKLRLQTPWHSVLLATSYNLSVKEKSVHAFLSLNNQTIFKMGMEHRSQPTEKIRTEKGMLNFQVWSLKPFETKWSFVSKRNEVKVKFDSKGLFKDNTNLKLLIKEVKSTRELSLFNKYQVSGSYETFFGSGKISGVASENYYGHRWDLKLDHSSKSNPKNNYVIMFRHKTEDKSSKTLRKYFLTSTISYGKFAENFIKFRVENEISGRHFRAAIKTSYGDSNEADKNNSEVIDLQLYGGFTWKEDNVHSAEGSLSFKFPSKGVNYEGRYNSEIGKRVFKVSMVLDKDQQSKVNFKLNYVQPKMYLKDTEMDIALSIPSITTDLKWVLQEVDVNKYKYSLTGSYNKYDMKIEGQQTQISRMKHDSSVRVFIPALKWPKINVDLRMDLENLGDASFKGKIDIPNSQHKYAIDLGLSFTPQNLLQPPISEKSSVFSYNFTVSNIQRTLQSSSVFTCNLEEVRALFNFGWDVDKNQNNQVTFDFHTLHKSPNYKQFESSAKLAIQYPGDSHSIGFRSNFKYTELEAQIDVIWNKNQRISIATTYEIDNSWTEKGLKGSITMKTPFSGMELTHLGISVLGQLRYRKVDIVFKWGGNKKILLDLVVQPRSSQDFTLTSKIVTPFKGWSLISLQTKYLMTTTSMAAEGSVELGPTRRYNIKFEGLDNSAGRNRDFKANIQVESGILPPLKVSFTHKDDKVHFKSEFEAIWKKIESLKVKSEFSYTLDDTELITTGNVEASSTIEAIKHLKTTWSMENRDSTFLNNVQIWYKYSNLFHNSIQGFFEKGDTSFKLEFKGITRIQSGQPYSVNNMFTYEYGDSLENNFSVMKDSVPQYSHNLQLKVAKIVFKMLVLNTEFKTVDFEATYKREGATQLYDRWLKVGEYYIFKETAVVKTSQDELGRFRYTMTHEIYSDHLLSKNITSKVSLTQTKDYLKIEAVSNSPTSEQMKFDLEMENKPTKRMFKMLLKSAFKDFRLVELELESLSNLNLPRIDKILFNYNDLLKATFSLRSKNLQFIHVDTVFKFKGFFRYLRLKHDIQRMGYHHLLETNLFNTVLKVVSDTEARGGVAIHTSVAYKLYKLEVVGRFSRKTSMLDIITNDPRSHRNLDSTVKVSFGRKNRHYSFDITSKTLTLTSLKLDLNDLNKLTLDFQSQDLGSIPNINMKFNFERVGWSYFRLQSLLKTDPGQLMDHTLGLEYRVRPSNYEITFNVNLNKRFFNVATKLFPTNDLRMEFKVETSSPALREVVFEMKHKQNSQLTQVTHSCKFLLKSHDRKFEIINRLEWSGLNFITLESSVVARIAKDSFFIKQKSIKWIHQFHKDVLKEDLNLIISEDYSVKGILELPLSLKSKSFFEIETSFNVLKKLKIETDLKASSTERSSLKISVERNYESLFSLDSSMEINKERVWMSLKVEEVNSHLLEIEYDRKTLSTIKFDVSAQTSMVPQTLKTKITYNYKEKEGSIHLSAAGRLSFYVSGELSNKSSKINFKCGRIKANWYHLRDVVQSKMTLSMDLQAQDNIKFELNMYKGTSNVLFALNEHSVKAAGVMGEEISLDVKMLKKEVSVKLKSLSKDPYKFELSGQTTFENWSSFRGDIYYVKGPENLEFTSRFSREDTNVYNIMFRNLQKAYNVKYKTMVDLAKSGELNVQYVGGVTVKFEAETVNKNFIKVDIKANKKEIEGKSSSSYHWLEKVVVKGSLNEEQDIVKGSFSVEHNKLKEPLKGEAWYKQKLTSWEVKVQTPFQKPLDKLTLTKLTEKETVSLELLSEGGRIFLGSLGKNSESKQQLHIFLNLPEQIANVEFTLNTLVNVQELPYFIKMTSKSNLYEEVTMTSTCDTSSNSYMVSFNHNAKKGGLTLKLRPTKTILTSEYNDLKTTVDLFHEANGPNNFNGKMTIVSNMYSSEPLTFSVSCKHNIDLPKAASLNFDAEWSEKTILSSKISWKMDDIEAFDLKSEMVLTPFSKEYKSSLEISKTDKELNIVFSPLGDSRLQDLTLKYVTEGFERRIIVNTPYEPIQRIAVKVKSERWSKNQKNMITLDSNYLGKVAYVVEVKENDLRISLTSPYGNAAYQDTTILGGERTINAVVDFGKEYLKVIIRRSVQEVEVKVHSSIEFIKKMKFLGKKDLGSYKAAASYNEYVSNLDIQYNSMKVKVLLETNSVYLKNLSFSLSGATKDSISLDLEVDGNKLAIVGKIDQDLWIFDWKNSLIPSLPSALEASFKYSGPSDLLVQVKLESRSLLKLMVNENEFLLNSEIRSRQVKLRVTRASLEMVILDKKFFSILIKRSAISKVDLALAFNGSLYISSLNYENNSDKILFKMTSSRNSVDQLVDLYVFFSKTIQEVNADLIVFKNPIFKLKYFSKYSPTGKISSELTVLSSTMIFDIDYTYKKDLFDLKFFWNVKFNNTQLCIGSLVYVVKTSVPINFLITFNAQRGSYQFQLAELEGKEFNVKISTPNKKLNLDLTGMVDYDARQPGLKVRLALKNGVIGEYDLKFQGQFTRDPEVRLEISNEKPLLDFLVKATTSVSDELSVMMMLKVLDWKKIELTAKLENKDDVRLSMKLVTPFRILKEVSVNKVLWLKSLWEHKFKSTMEYKGLFAIKFIGGHEISCFKRILRVNGKVHSREVQIISIDLKASESEGRVEHLFILDLKERRYGYKVNGHLDPLIEGKTEIYTPFHNAGVLTLQGRRLRNGVNIQVGRNHEQVAAFEYSSTNEVRYLKVVPPKSFGQPMAMKHRVRRHKRSVGDQTETSVKYGGETVFDLNSKVNLKNDKNVVLFKFSAPMLTEKTAEMKLSHKIEGDTVLFNHHLKVKDSVERLYKVFGDLYRKDAKNFKFAVNVLHPKSGPWHVSFGRNSEKNTHNSHFLVKNDKEVWIMHKGRIIFEMKKIDGEWELQMPKKHIKVVASHSGDLDRSQQNLQAFYNAEPYFLYKSNIVLQETSVVELSLPLMDGAKTKVTFNNPKRSVTASLNTTSVEYLLEMVDKDGQFKALLQVNNEKVAYIALGYASTPIYVQGTFLKHFIKVEASLKESEIILKSESSVRILKQAKLNLRKNKVMVDVVSNGEPYSASLEYHFIPNNFFLILETSNKLLSKASIFVTPSEVKVNVNEYFQILRFILTRDNLMIDSENNFFLIRVIRLNGVFNRLTNNLKWKVEVDSFVTELEVSYSAEKVTLEFKNSKWSPRVLAMSMKYVSKDNGARFFKSDLKVDQWNSNLMIGKSRSSKYAIQWDSTPNVILAASFDTEKNEFILGLYNSGRFFNAIARAQKMDSGKSTTIVTHLTLESSSRIIGKTTAQASYTASSSEMYISFTGHNFRGEVEAKARLTSSEASLLLNLNKDIYSAKVSLPSSKELSSEFRIPNQRLVIEIKGIQRSYTFNVFHNENNLLKVNVNQDWKVGTSFEHSSEVSYFGQNVWSVILNTNFQRLTLKMKTPVMFETILVNEWDPNKGRTMSVWIKYPFRGTKVEQGLGFTLNLDPKTTFVEIFTENNHHVIKLSTGCDPSYDTHLSASLLNKASKNKWEMTLKAFKKDKVEILWSSPTGKRVFKLNQTFKDNKRTSIDIEINDLLKVALQSNPNTKLLQGTLTLFNKKIARIQLSDDLLQATINEDGPEDRRISFEWTKRTTGEWKKDYVSSRTLRVKQKALKIDIDMKNELRMETLNYGVKTNIKYLSINGISKTLDLAAVADFGTTDQITIEVKNPILPLQTVLRRSQPSKASLQYDVEMTFNSNNKIKGFFEVSTGHDLGFTSRFYYDPERTSSFFEVHAKYLDDRQAEVRVFLQTERRSKNYFKYLVRLLNENSIETTFERRPFRFRHIAPEFEWIKMEADKGVKKFFDSDLPWIMKESRGRYRQLLEVVPGGSDIGIQMNSLKKSLVVETGSFLEEIETMFRKDEFYMLTVRNAVYTQVYKAYVIFGDVLHNMWYAFLSIDAPRILDYLSDFQESITNFIVYVTKINLLPLERMMSSIVRNYCPRMISNVVDNAATLKTFVQDTYSVVRMKIMELRRARNVFILNFVKEFCVKLSGAVRSVFGFVSGDSLNFLYQEKELKYIYGDVIRGLEEVAKWAVERLNTMGSGLDDKLYSLTGDRICSMIGKMIADACSYVIQEMKNEGNQRLVQRMLMSAVQESFQEINLKVTSFMANLILPKLTIVKRLDNYPHIVVISVVTSPIPLNDIKSIPDFTYVSKKVEEVKNIVRLSKNMLKEHLLSGRKFLDLMRWFTPQLPIGSFPSILPDFENYATILGSSVVTFDKRSFQLKPDLCRVILAKDNLFKKWEIILDQNKEGRVFTLSLGSERVSISMKDNKVALNGKSVELPLFVGSTRIMAYGSVVRAKDENLGLTVTIDPTNDMLTVGISGWYHDRVRGLFGNSDNEPFNDMLDEGGRLLKSKEFFKVFSNGGTSCQIHNELEKEFEDNKSCPFLRKIVCKFLYKCPVSPMAACFGKVDPKRFFKQCINSSTELEAILDPSICQSARSYQAQCAAAGVHIPVPSPCRKCDIKGEKSISVNAFKEIKNKEKVADIVFMVDEGTCLKNIGSQVGQVIKSLDISMKEKGISSIRFGLVTFGGDGVNEAHTHTIGQRLFGSADELVAATKTLLPTDQKVKDTVGAIMLASSYPFRAHASKHLVLISCDQCGESSSLFKNLQELLEKQAIQFSVMLNFNFQVKEGDSKKIIYGVDSKNIYTSVSRRGEVGNDVKRPNADFCYQLAMKRHGVVFNDNYLISKTESSRKRFIETFSTQVSLTAIPARTTSCRCADDGEYNCVPLDTYSIFPAKKAT